MSGPAGAEWRPVVHETALAGPEVCKLGRLPSLESRTEPSRTLAKWLIPRLTPE